MKKYRIGLDFSEKKWQLAVVAKQKDGWQLMETFSVEGATDNRPSILQATRRRIARSVRHTVLSLPHNQVLMKEIRLDATLNSHEIYQHLQQQAVALFGKPADHWYFDFEPLVFSTHIAQQTCFRVAAAPRDTVLSAVALCRELGLQVQTVTVDVLALANLAHTLQNYRSDQAQAIVWLKAHELLFMVTLSGHLIFSKTTTYLAMHNISEVLIPIIHFFNGLYPHTILESIFLMSDDPLSLSIGDVKIENAALNTNLWQVPHVIRPEEFCSLGLAIYGH